MPRPRIEKARRAFFDFAMSNIPDMLTLGHALEAIETSLVSPDRRDDWPLHLSDESLWRQIDMTVPGSRPQQGMPIRIWRAAVGGGMFKIGNSPAVRALPQ